MGVDISRIKSLTFFLALGVAGAYPYTRGPYPSMYTGRLWTMRQYAGFGDAGATNLRFRTLLHAGQTGLSVAFDLPTQMGLDSDDPMSAGEVGKVGVAIDTIVEERLVTELCPKLSEAGARGIVATGAVDLGRLGAHAHDAQTELVGRAVRRVKATTVVADLDLPGWAVLC